MTARAQHEHEHESVKYDFMQIRTKAYPWGPCGPFDHKCKEAHKAAKIAAGE